MFEAKRAIVSAFSMLTMSQHVANASGESVESVVNARSRAAESAISTHRTSILNRGAAAMISDLQAPLPALAGFHSTAIFETFGASSFSNANRFSQSSSLATPVRLPPGLGRLA